MKCAYSIGDDVCCMCVIFAMVSSLCGGNCCTTTGAVVCWALLHSGIIHRPVVVHFLPQMIVFPLYLMVQPILLMVTSHPALQRVTMEMREWEDRLGRMCAIRALSGRPSMASWHVWVE